MCGGSGECPKCFGSGKNTRLNTPEEHCSTCRGTGKCPACGGASQPGPITRFLLWVRGDR